ncbi:hypothetical protein Pta02_50990 [Planobispora takensis]|uniref:Uncharacterized protein n=1 Tax=Planobispora takensis TaxID=1367882 RepID=A0A8J3T284_9ACTN|nr:hypothetical protein Pta02_50990 [Planobispora takensis]
MRHNRRPPLLASAMPPNHLNLRPGERLMAVCPDCNRWRLIRRSMLWPHRTDDGTTRCPGSAQRVIIDLTPTQWLARLAMACRQAATRRTRRIQLAPQPPTPTPIHRLTAA